MPLNERPVWESWKRMRKINFRANQWPGLRTRRLTSALPIDDHLNFFQYNWMAHHSHIAFSIPEIIRLICLFSIRQNHWSHQNRAALNLVLVSRDFFYAIVPVIWKIINIKDLLRLIPCVEPYLEGKWVPRPSYQLEVWRVPCAYLFGTYGCRLKNLVPKNQQTNSSQGCSFMGAMFKRCLSATHNPTNDHLTSCLRRH